MGMPNLTCLKPEISPQILTLPCGTTLHEGWPVEPLEHCRNNGVQLLRLVHKRSVVSTSFLDHLHSEASCYVVRTFKQPYWDERLMWWRHWGILPTGIPVSPFRCRSSSPGQAFGWLQPQPTAWLQSHKTWSQNHPIKPLLNSWPTELKNQMFVVLSHNFRGNLLHSSEYIFPLLSPSKSSSSSVVIPISSHSFAQVESLGIKALTALLHHIQILQQILLVLLVFNI